MNKAFWIYCNGLCFYCVSKPEAISGSSRMKGGSATKIILETVFLAGHEAAFSRKAITFKYVKECFSSVHTVYTSFHFITPISCYHQWYTTLTQHV